VAHADGAPLDLRERAVALVLGQPHRAADGRRAVGAVAAELALAVAPELAQDRLRPLLLLLLCRLRRRPGALQRRALRARDLALEDQVGDQRLGLLGLLLRDRLLDLEDAVVEVRGLGLLAAGVRRRGQRDAALARVQLRAHRDVLRAREGDEA